MEGQFISAPVQLAAVHNPALIDLDKELAAGQAIRIRQTFYWLQRVVYTAITSIRSAKSTQVKERLPRTFIYGSDTPETARYGMSSSVPQQRNQLTIPNFSCSNRRLPDFTIAFIVCTATFRGNFDFHDYPFDTQDLTLRLTNPRMTPEQVIYAIDTFGLHIASAEPGFSKLRALSNWNIVSVRPEINILTSQSTRGQPGAFHGSYQTQFSGFDTVITVKRKTAVFLFKNLLPLILLVLVVYVTLYFPMSLIKERLTIAISAMLASAVLLTALNSQLFDVGYTTAIKYGFYAFFALCIYCVLAGLIAERLHQKKNSVLADRFDVAVRITYPLIVLVVTLVYAVHYKM